MIIPVKYGNINYPDFFKYTSEKYFVSSVYSQKKIYIGNNKDFHINICFFNYSIIDVIQSKNNPSNFALVSSLSDKNNVFINIFL